MSTTNWLTAAEAMTALGVTRETLYAYVSRGRIRSEPTPGKTRQRRYSGDDVERLLARKRERRSPERAAGQALDWGLPILESSITLIADDRLFYRGQDAAELARSAPLADVAGLIWTGEPDGSAIALPEDDASFDARIGRASRRDEAPIPFIPRAQSLLAERAAADPLAYDLRPAGIVRTGWRILRLLTEAAAASPVGTESGREGRQLTAIEAAAETRADTVDRRLADAWGAPDGADLIRAALILCADHELNVSSFTARCVASAGASPYGAVIAGLAALEGFRHGGTTARIEAFWDALVGAPAPDMALSERLRRGEPIEGFGHRLYPTGDPRARVLLDLLPATPVTHHTRAFIDRVRTLIGEHPTVDFALVALARALGLPAGSPLTMFAIGRSIGWIGQAIEQYGEQTMIRPRARYVGKVPDAPHVADRRRIPEQ